MKSGEKQDFDQDESVLNPINFEAASLKEFQDSESKSLRKSQEFTANKKNSSDLSTSKKNPYIPQGLHTAGRKVSTGLKNTRYREKNMMEQTMADLGSLKMVQKKLDFQQNIIQPNLEADIELNGYQSDQNPENEKNQESSESKSEEYEF